MGTQSALALLPSDCLDRFHEAYPRLPHVYSSSWTPGFSDEYSDGLLTSAITSARADLMDTICRMVRELR